MNPWFSPETQIHNLSHQILKILCQVHCLPDGQNLKILASASVNIQELEPESVTSLWF